MGLPHADEQGLHKCWEGCSGVWLEGASHKVGFKPAGKGAILAGLRICLLSNVTMIIILINWRDWGFACFPTLLWSLSW